MEEVRMRSLVKSLACKVGVGFTMGEVQLLVSPDRRPVRLGARRHSGNDGPSLP